MIASLALVAGAVVNAAGSAVVVNKCNYPVYLYDVPSAGGGFSEIDKVLSSGGTFTQQWTQLTNGNGWSIKLSNSTNLASILQYEYTFHNDGIIWYDLSEVDGNPWNGNWEITADSASCIPRQAAYRYATDDAYGMQSCPDSSTITVTLCSGESQNDGAAASASSSVAAATSSIAASSMAASVSSKAAASSTSAVATSNLSSAVATSNQSAAVTVSQTAVVTTTLQTSVITSAPSSGGSTAVVTVTQAATTTYWTHHWGPPGKRDAHHHAARHPHVRN